MTEAPPTIAVRGLSKAYPGTKALDDVSLDLRAGRIACLLGPSGCGKSTLLRLLAGLETPDAGTIEADGRLLSGAGTAVPPERRGIGLIFQDAALFPHLTVVENVAFGLERMSRAARKARALDLLGDFQLGHRADAWPHTLSGGEQQRVAIARALARSPMAVLLDEPFSGLDGDLRGEVRRIVLSGLRAAGAAVLIVSHDPGEALLMADDLALMSAGRLLQSGSPEDCYLNPVSLPAARLLGPVTVVPARVAGGRARSPFGALATDRADGPAVLLVRPEGLTLDADGAPVTVRAVRFAGAWREVEVEADGQLAILRHSGPGAVTPGPARVRLDPARARLLDA